MGSQNRAWQDLSYVLCYFDETTGSARRRYCAYVMEGVGQGRRPELVGGGLIRSLGGWSALKKIRLGGYDRRKGDERILGDSDFVLAILAEANEQLDRFYELQSRGYDLKEVEQRVMETFEINRDEIYSKGRRRSQVEARSLLCYWAVRLLGLTATDLANRLSMTQPAIGYAVSRGEQLAKNMDYRLT